MRRAWAEVWDALLAAIERTLAGIFGRRDKAGLWWRGGLWPHERRGLGGKRRD